MRILGVLLAVLCVGGCASFQYEIVSPAEFQAKVSSDAKMAVKIDPLEYTFRTRSNRLVMTIFNPTDDAVNLIGPQSAVIDPNGRARTIFGQAIPPGAFARLVFPPQRSRSNPGSSRMRVGVGVNMRVDAGPPSPSAEPCEAEPVHAAAISPKYPMMMSDNSFWEWRGDGSISVLLV